MEKSELKLIRDNFSELINSTKCTTEFLNFFYEKGILTSGEYQRIACQEVDEEKAVKFYQIIQIKKNAFPILLEGLGKCLQTGALHILKTTDSSDVNKENVSFDEIPPVKSFTGRTVELEQLHQMVLRSQGAERVAVVSQVTSVSGLGGIGKTQLVREYVRLKRKEFDGNVLWMNAESEESLLESFQRLSEEKLNIPSNDYSGKLLPAENIAQSVYNHFTGKKALFVLDNAEKAPWLKQFMPKIGQTFRLFILITSRERVWDRGMEVLQLDGLTEDDAVKLIYQELKIIKKDIGQMTDIKQLARNLEGFPLALQQAIAYIAEQRITMKYSIADYLQEFESKHYQLLAFQEDQLCNESFTTTTDTTWSITFDKIKNLKNGWLASLILNVVAYLGADNIKRNLFYLIPSVQTDTQFASVNDEQVNDAVRLLVKYSMLNGVENQSLLSVHRLVQSVTRNQLTRKGMEERYLEVALQLLQGSDHDDFPAENIAHALIVWRHAFIFHQITKSYAWQVERILWKMREVGRHDEGLRFGNDALEKFKEVLGENHLECLYIRRSIGLILREQGYVDGAVSVFEEILIKAESLYGEDSEISLVTKEDLGNSSKRNGKYQNALKILREVLGKKKAIFGDNHSRTLTTEENYGLALLESGNLTEAEKIFGRIIQIYIEKGNESSTKVLQLQTNLSTIYCKKGEHEKALEIRSEVYKKLSPLSTQNVELFIVVCCKLGKSLNMVGKHEEALKILEGNIEKIKNQLGSQHARTLQIQEEIGISYQGLGNYRKALEIFQSVYQSYVSLSGEDSLSSLNANEHVAITLSRLGKHSQALSKFKKILSKMEVLLGNESLKVITTKWEFARAIERSAENMDTALDLLKNAKDAIISILGEDSPRATRITVDISRMEKKIKTKDSISKCLIS